MRHPGPPHTNQTTLSAVVLAEKADTYEGVTSSSAPRTSTRQGRWLGRWLLGGRWRQPGWAPHTGPASRRPIIDSRSLSLHPSRSSVDGGIERSRCCPTATAPTQRSGLSCTAIRCARAAFTARSSRTSASRSSRDASSQSPQCTPGQNHQNDPATRTGLSPHPSDRRRVSEVHDCLQPDPAGLQWRPSQPRLGVPCLDEPGYSAADGTAVNPWDCNVQRLSHPKWTTLQRD